MKLGVSLGMTHYQVENPDLNHLCRPHLHHLHLHYLRLRRFRCQNLQSIFWLHYIILVHNDSRFSAICICNC